MYAKNELKAILEAVPDAIVTADPAGAILSINPAASRLLGYRVQDLIGREFNELITHCPGRPETTPAVRLSFATHDGGFGSECEIGVLHRNGGALPMRMTCNTYRVADEQRRVIVLADLSGLKQEQERLRNVIEGTNAATWEWIVDTGETIFNERWAEIIGYTLDELRPTTFDTWAGFMHPEDLAEAHKLLQAHFDGLSDHYSIECRIRHKDGRWVWTHDRGKIVERHGDGRPRRVAGTHIDISQRKAAEADVLATNEALKQSNMELERFAYSASHDLQEPLRMVASFTQLLGKKYADQLDETAQEYIHFAVDGAQRMQRLVRDLLSYSRLGRQVVDEKPVDIAALAARVLQSLKLAIDESGAEIECRDLPVVRGDAGQLFRLIQNLISNAIKYRGEAAPIITFSTHSRADGLVFCLRDNGIGIEPENGDRVFEVFQRIQTRTKCPGSGIGLSVCRRVVERHGGRIWFESTPGAGTAFLFTLAADRYAMNRDEGREAAGDDVAPARSAGVAG